MVQRKYKKHDDAYPQMTEDIVKKLWNEQRYSREGLRNIALLLLQWVENE